MSTIYKTEAGGNEIQRRYAEILDGWPVPAEHLRTVAGVDFSTVQPILKFLLG